MCRTLNKLVSGPGFGCRARGRLQAGVNEREAREPFNGFAPTGKTVRAAWRRRRYNMRLKPDAKERNTPLLMFTSFIARRHRIELWFAHGIQRANFVVVQRPAEQTEFI